MYDSDVLFSTTIKKTLHIILTILLAISAWFFWQTPKPASAYFIFKTALPTHLAIDKSMNNNNSQQLWRIVTRRVISKDGLHALTKRLNEMNLKAIKIERREEVTMHAFDDNELFKNRNLANIAAKYWESHNISTNVIRARKGVYLLSLGRFYQSAYATAMQKKLKNLNREHRYQQRIISIPTWRFTFKADSKTNSENLWRRLNRIGTITPVIMSEKSFQAHYYSTTEVK